MREILFKAKQFDTGKWIEGYLVQQKNNLGGIHTCIFQNFESENRWEMKRVDSNTVCQYTGMTDKNGNKIFENDIVESYIEYDDFRRKREKGILRYTYGMYEVQIEECDGKPVYSDFMAGIALSGCPFEISVLGNIFDNPELI